MIEHLDFLNGLEIGTNLVKISNLDRHQIDDMFGWQGLASLICLNDIGEIYDIDIRYAWSAKIFQQHLVDCGYSEAILLGKKSNEKLYRHKLIIYLCESSTGLNNKQHLETTSEHNLIGRYWQTISHLYLLLPFEHPFENQIHRNQKLNFEESYLVDHEPIIHSSEYSQIEIVSTLSVKPGNKQEGGLRTKGIDKISTQNKPLISVVTVVFNGEQFLEQTIQSVINQSYQNIEYIVIDGASTDKTLDIIKEYEEYIDYWVSEPDQGIYDAMNKGIKASLGELIGLINSGDLYANDAIEQIVEIYNFHKNSHENIIITGTMYKFNNDSSFLFKLVKKQEDLESGINKRMPINHPTTFVSMKTYETLGCFDSKFRICGDYDFIFRAYHSSLVKFIFTDAHIAYMRLGGVSEQFKSLWTNCIEHFLIRKQNIFWINNAIISMHWLSLALIKFLIKNISGKKLTSIYYRHRHN
jgi:glycosyltransferase involved in cell wall biosynthesis